MTREGVEIQFLELKGLAGVVQKNFLGVVQWSGQILLRGQALL